MKPLILLACMLTAGCAGAATSSDPQAQPEPITPASPPPPATALVPAGHGTLKQDEFTMNLRRGPLLIKVTPLEESIIRLAAPDTYERLRALAENRRAEVLKAAGEQDVSMFLVSFFSYEPDVTFQPEDLQLSHQGRALRPAAIVAVTPGWGRQRLAQQESQTAVYGFVGGISYDQPLIVRYGLEQTDSWTSVIPKLEVERAKVRARAGAGTTGG